MRADRLVATLLLIQSRGRVTAAEVAKELEISIPTARRDLEALSTAGIPVYPQPGRGGGWQLVGGARTDLTGLTETEARGLFLLLGPAASLNPSVKSALRKLVRALPATFRSGAELATEAVAVDPAGWGKTMRDRPEAVDLLQTAIINRRKIKFGYLGRTGEASERVVDPWGVVAKHDLWYLIAGTDRGRRTYRIDRIADLELTDLTSQRPHDFDLATAWRETAELMEQQRSLVSATVLIKKPLLHVVQQYFGRHCTLDDHGEQPPAGYARAIITAHTTRSVAEQLAGWGSALRVLEPESVRHELAKIGTELSDRYGRSDDHELDS